MKFKDLGSTGISASIVGLGTVAIGGWRQSMKESGGGVLFDMGSHAIDIVYYCL